MKKIEQISSKSVLKSKTVWIGLAIAILPWLESVQEMATSPGTISIIGLIVIALRFLTTKPVTLN